MISYDTVTVLEKTRRETFNVFLDLNPLLEFYLSLE